MFPKGGNRSLLFLFLTLVNTAFPKQDFIEKSLSTNVQMFQKAVSEITHSLLNELHITEQDTVEVRVFSPHVFVEHQLIQSLREHRIVTTAISHAYSNALVWETYPTRTNVEYSRPFRVSFWGTRYIERSVTLALSLKLSRKQTSEMIFSGEKYWSAKDTIRWDDVNTVENLSFDVTVGKKENVSWMDEYVEPFIILGTTAIVIFLFFTVRS
jgi:hypothetical protein